MAANSLLRKPRNIKDNELDFSQTAFEALYRMQLTQNMTISPDLQVTFKPSLNDQNDEAVVGGLRMRLKF